MSWFHPFFVAAAFSCSSHLEKSSFTVSTESTMMPGSAPACSSVQSRRVQRLVFVGPALSPQNQMAKPYLICCEHLLTLKLTSLPPTDLSAKPSQKS
jgi:hypothetical protein